MLTHEANIKQWYPAIYARLSDEDRENKVNGVSLSIDHQIDILKSYVKDKGWQEAKVFFDDNRTGTDFNRKGFQDMYSEAQKGSINVIIIKDTSRFGRNWVKSGDYFDRIEEMGIRFISLQEGIDTIDPKCPALKMLPFYFIFNEWHSQTTSEKIKAVLANNAKKGKYRSAFAPYGYQKDPNDKHKLVIDPYSSEIVKLIFEMRLQKYSYGAIINALNTKGILSPSAYLHEFDMFMLNLKKQFDMGETACRKVHENHEKVRWAFRKSKKNLENNRSEENIKSFKKAQKTMLSTPHLSEMDINYKRLQYNRYADDFLISIIGSKENAQNIKEQVRVFLQDVLKLTMSEEKTHITHSAEMVRYLGYDIRISRSQDFKRTKKGLQRVWYGKVQLYVPKEKWISKLHEYKALKIKKDENGKEIWKPLHRGALMPLDDVAIISKYNSEIRGLYNYYRMAINACNLGKFHSIMRGSCLKTLAAKYNSSVMKMYIKYRSKGSDFGADYKTKSGIKRCEFYNDGFKRNKKDAPQFADTIAQYRVQVRPNSLAGRLKSGICETCGASPVKVYMHHVKRLKDLNADNDFELLMIQKRRKSLALCPKCYEETKNKIT